MRNVENHHQCFCAMENPIWNAPTVKNTVFANSLCFLCMPLETVCAGHWHKLLDFCFVFIFGTFHGSFCHSIKAMFVSFAFIFACTKLFHFFIWKICITSLTTQNWITNEWLFTGSCAFNGFVYLFKFCSIKLKNMFVSMCEAIGLTQRDNNGEWQWVLIVPQLHWLNSHFNYFWSNLCVKWMCWSCIHCLMCCGGVIFGIRGKVKSVRSFTFFCVSLRHPTRTFLCLEFLFVPEYNTASLQPKLHLP